jgi:hypothetical protein
MHNITMYTDMKMKTVLVTEMTLHINNKDMFLLGGGNVTVA